MLFIEGARTLGSLGLLLLGQVMEPATLRLNEITDSLFQLWVVEMYFLIVVDFSFQRIPVLLQMIQYFSLPNVFDAFRTLISLKDFQLLVFWWICAGAW